MAVRLGYERIGRTQTYREAAPAMKAELDQAETASHLGEESRCAMILSALQIELRHLLLHIHDYSKLQMTQWTAKQACCMANKRLCGRCELLLPCFAFDCIM